MQSASSTLFGEAMTSRTEEEGIITLRNRSGEDESNDRDECSDSTFQRDSDGVQCSPWHCKSSLEKRAATASCGGVFRHQTLPQPLTTPCPPEPEPSTSTAAVASERRKKSLEFIVGYVCYTLASRFSLFVTSLLSLLSYRREGCHVLCIEACSLHCMQMIFP